MHIVLHIPEGVYPAIAAGHTTKFKAGANEFTAKFHNAVKGFDIQDKVVVKDDAITSDVLGTALGVFVPLPTPGVPNGHYDAITGGHEAKFEYKGRLYYARFENGVRGMNYTDTVTVNDGVCHSLVIPGEGKLVTP